MNRTELSDYDIFLFINRKTMPWTIFTGVGSFVKLDLANNGDHQTMSLVSMLEWIIGCRLTASVASVTGAMLLDRKDPCAANRLSSGSVRVVSRKAFAEAAAWSVQCRVGIFVAKLWPHSLCQRRTASAYTARLIRDINYLRFIFNCSDKLNKFSLVCRRMGDHLKVNEEESRTEHRTPDYE